MARALYPCLLVLRKARGCLGNGKIHHVGAAVLVIGGKNIHWVVVLSGLLFVLGGRSHASDMQGQLSSGCHIDGDVFTDAVVTWMDQTFAHSCTLRAITFDTDVPMSDVEFQYLTDLRPGVELNAARVKTAVRYLQKKRLFKTFLMKTEHHESGMDIHITAHAVWTFAKLKIHGLLTDKDKYKRFYLLEPGEPFNEEKHKRSLENIQDSLCSVGYYAAALTTRFVYDHVRKNVTVHTTIDRGKQFGIGDLTLMIQSLDTIDEAVLKGLRLEIERKFFKPLQKKSYCRESVAHQAGQLRSFLVERGFFNATVKVTEKVVMRDHKVHVSFTLVLHQPREFIFVGNRFFTKAQLRDALTLFGRSALLLPERLLKKELLMFYKTKGFFDTCIETKQEQGRIFFIIREGARSHLTSVILQGTTLYPADSLVKEYFQECLRASFIDQAEVHKALAAITALYADNGFLDARFVQSDYEKVGDTARALMATLDEGPVYTITSSQVEGNLTYSNQGPLAACNNGQTVPFTTQEMRTQQEWLTSELNKDNPYPVVVRPTIEREGTTIRIIWRCSAEHQARFGKTVIVGMPTLPFECIMRELIYKEQDPWDRTMLKKTMENVRSLGVFDRVDLHPDGNDEYLADKTIIAQLQMDDPYEIRTRAGLGFQQVSHVFNFLGFTYRAGGSFIVKNPFNVGDQCSCEVDFAKFDTKIVAAYRRPWFLGLPLTALFQLYHSRQSHPGIIKSSENIYQVTQQGCMATMSYAHAYGTLGFNTGVEYMETSTADAAGQNTHVADGLARAINFAPQLLDKKVPYFLLEPTVLIDRLDNNIQTTQGTFTLISLKGMFPLSSTGGRSFFVRCTLEQSLFIPLRQAVAAFRVRLGHIFHDSFRTIMPPERFYLGGAHSIRSYDMDFAPPLGVFKDSAGVLHRVPRGGKSMVNLNVELRMPPYKRVGLVLFQDVGGLRADSLAALQSEDLLAATGFGLRYDTAFGPLRFDIGWKWRHNQPFDASYAWFLTLGQAF